MKCTLTIGDSPCTYAVFDIDDLNSAIELSIKVVEAVAK